MTTNLEAYSAELKPVIAMKIVELMAKAFSSTNED